jgi:hypothetical protein
MWGDARELLDLFLRGPEGRGWQEYEATSSSGFGGGGGLLDLISGQGGRQADAEYAVAAAAAATAAALRADGDLAAAAALLRVLPRGAARALQQGMESGGAGGLQMMCLESEALSMCC